MECELCAKTISKHAGSRFCRSCQIEISEKEGRKAAEIPKEEEYVSQELYSGRWNKMGHWASTGKGRTYIDNSPGASLNSASLLFAFGGLLFLFVHLFLGIGAIIVAIVLQVLKNKEREKYLKDEYKKKYSYLDTQTETPKA